MDDEGNKFNRVRSFRVLGFDPVEPDPFAPQEDPGDKSLMGNAAALFANPTIGQVEVVE